MTIRTASHETPAGSRSSRARRAAAALVACLAVALLILPGCTSAGGSNAETIRVGVCAGPYQDMFEQAIEPSLTEQGYSVKYVEFSDYVQPNNALADGEIDLNLFQHATYLESFSKQHNLDLASIVEVPTAAMGVFLGKAGSLDQLPPNATVAIPNDDTNLSRALRVLQQAAGRELSRRHLLALEELCSGAGLGYADVPGLRVTREQGRLFFGAQALPPLGTHALHPGEAAEIPELGLRITVGEPEPFREIHSAFTTFCFKSAIIHDKLSVTPRRPGDRIRLAGRGCTKRVSDLFAERRLTQSARDRVPIIRAADVPAAIAGFGVAEQWAAAPDQTMICIRMEQIQTYGGEYYERYER